MNADGILMAAFEPLPQWANFLVMIGILMLVAIGALIWLVKFRKKGKRKYRRHQHEQRKLNPTLAESGGLPPARENEKSPGHTPPP
jgi:hypothetical protein